MAATARPVARPRRRLVAVGAVLSATLLLTLDQMAAPRPVGPADRALGEGTGAASSQAASSAAPVAAARGASTSWARNVSGTVVQVTPTHYVTPIHPEVLTHPDADAMGEHLRSDAAPVAATQPLAAAPGGNGLAGQAVVGNPIRADNTITGPPGIDVSSHQGKIDWGSVAPHVGFVYAKATEGTYYQNPDFDNQYEGPYDHGVIRGAYHFAIPSNSSGTAQADYFIANGGGWSSDGLTLPGALDIEYNPYGAKCYGLTPAQMTAWISNFVTEYAAKEHAYPVIYSTTDWWKTCTGDTGSFSSLDPFWVANYSTAGPGALPTGWDYCTFWQSSDHGSLPGDQDVFNGGMGQLRTLAYNG